MPIDFDPHKAASSPFVVGAVGALVGLKWAPGATWLARIWNVFCGAMIAGFVTGAMLESLGVKSPAMLGGMSFMLGAAGMSLMDAIITGVRETKLAEIITSWLQRRGP